MTNQLGLRIAQLRTLHGWTQQDLAERLAISRVAVSHLEAGISLPGERTVTLLAGLFKLDPPALVAGTGYPEAKAERLPSVACRYTEIELQRALLRNDLSWLERLRRQPGWQRLALDVCQDWLLRLDDLDRALADAHERALLVEARSLLQATLREALAPPQKMDE